MYARVVSRDRSSNSTASANISMSRFEGDPRELVFFCRSPKRTSETQFVVRSIHFHPRLNGGVRGGTTSTSVSPQITTKLTRGGWIGERRRGMFFGPTLHCSMGRRIHEDEANRTKWYLSCMLGRNKGPFRCPLLLSLLTFGGDRINVRWAFWVVFSVHFFPEFGLTSLVYTAVSEKAAQMTGSSRYWLSVRLRVTTN